MTVVVINSLHSFPDGGCSRLNTRIVLIVGRIHTEVILKVHASKERGAGIRGPLLCDSEFV